MIDLKEEYNQISEDWRHRDKLTWQLPSVIVVIGSALMVTAFTLDIDRPCLLYVIRSILLLFGGFLSLCLTFALKENLWYQIGSGEVLIKIVQGKKDIIPTDKLRRIIKPEDIENNKYMCMKQLCKKHRLTGSYFFYIFCIFVTIILFGLSIWSIVESMSQLWKC